MTENETEKKQVEQVVAEYAKAIDRFKKKEYAEAGELFGKIVDTYGDSDYYHVLEVQARASVYQKICEIQSQGLKRLQPETNDEHLSDGIYHLNIGNLDKALERFLYLEKQNEESPYLSYLIALTYLKKDNTENCLKYLKAAIEKDNHYKVVAHNEPDFDVLFDNDVFASIIEIDESF